MCVCYSTYIYTYIILFGGELFNTLSINKEFIEDIYLGIGRKTFIQLFVTMLIATSLIPLLLYILYYTVLTRHHDGHTVILYGL
jgi:hypothetical protein